MDNVLDDMDSTNSSHSDNTSSMQNNYSQLVFINNTGGITKSGKNKFFMCLNSFLVRNYNEKLIFTSPT